ncbi:MAG TPA: DUF423 domain-containing protein [Steroidobacteraceae bacterium]|jgi:uncharacterized membrane protein YgdD (TMEM256/DUF423 family)|nr:DUF423 domain-containing protein [Steroidobacteraceae bacterium]HNS26730.1 DUF423 domain-containing protein [Steroidobacteraceae bacterium]
MNNDARRTLAIAALLVALATALGAFGAHGLRDVLTPERLDVFETGVRYHFYHTLGLLALGVLAQLRPARGLRLATKLIVAGIVVFSGSIYALTFGAPLALGMVTPLGGLLLMLGWILVALTVWSAR